MLKDFVLMAFLAAYLLLFLIPPCLLVLREKNVSRDAKAAGVIASLVFSWVGLAGYYLIRMLRKRAANA